MTDDTLAKPPCVVPTRTDGPFKRIWRELPQVRTLHTPVSAAETWPMQGELTMVKRAVHGEESTLLQADYGAGFEYSDESLGTVRLGMVYTDERIPPLRFGCGELPTLTMLSRMYWNSRLNGVCFNPQDPENRVETTGYILKREAVARLVGMMAARDPLAYEANHMPQARQALSDDRIFEAFYHVAEAREEGEALDSVFPVEMQVLIALQLYRQAIEYREWYLDKARRNTPASDLFTAWLILLQGQPKEALAIIENYSTDETWGPTARLLAGKVMVAAGALPDAIDWFDACLVMAPDHTQSILEKAVALRNLHWQSGDREGLGEAKALLEKLLPVTVFHKPQVLHHLATLSLAFDDAPMVEKYTRESLALQNNPTVRRNLILSLLAQDRREEAAGHYEILQRYESREAATIAKHFTPEAG